ncbi:MAG: hypothetical protein H5T74_01720 [Actinobacteria bacterium]|nr:hypothetical protein [Actinomycetota bacterium]
MNRKKKRLKNKHRGERKRARMICGRASEAGFAMAVVLVALTLLSMLGAASLLLMTSALQGVVNAKPEELAFQITETAIYNAHAMIVNDAIPAPDAQPVTGSAFGGSYKIWIQKSGGFDYVVTAEGLYARGGREYRRKIREEVSYSGPQALDVLRNYVIYAGNDFNWDSVDGLINVSDFVINGNIRAEHKANIDFRNGILSLSRLTHNGNLEGVAGVDITAGSALLAAAEVNIFGDILTGLKKTGSTGVVNLAVIPVLAVATINAATNGKRIYAREVRKSGQGLLGYINTGTVVNASGCEEIYLPKPNYEYYKALAKEQGNYFVGNKTLTGNLGDYSHSSVTVVYCTGNLTLNGLLWNQPNMKGIFVCEGDFTARNGLQLRSNCEFQVIAKGDANILTAFDLTDPASTKFFIYSGRDVNLGFIYFAGQSCQVTALRDVNIEKFSLIGVSLGSINHLPPTVDVAGFPVELTVRNWRELPSEQSYLQGWNIGGDGYLSGLISAGTKALSPPDIFAVETRRKRFS